MEMAAPEVPGKKGAATPVNGTVEIPPGALCEMLTTADLAESAVTGKKDTTTIRLPPASMTAEFILTRNSEAFSPPTLILLMLSVMVLSFRISNVLYDPGPPTIT
ncbi:MAG: hypothetical protein AAB928_01695, partial [Patescibacteria group bacterium]